MNEKNVGIEKDDCAVAIEKSGKDIMPLHSRSPSNKTLDGETNPFLNK